MGPRPARPHLVSTTRKRPHTSTGSVDGTANPNLDVDVQRDYSNEIHNTRWLGGDTTSCFVLIDLRRVGG